jgi:hypothetical protein
MHPPEWEAGPPNGAPTATSSTPRPPGRPWRRRVSGRGASELVNKSARSGQSHTFSFRLSSCGSHLASRRLEPGARVSSQSLGGRVQQMESGWGSAAVESGSAAVASGSAGAVPGSAGVMPGSTGAVPGSAAVVPGSAEAESGSAGVALAALALRLAAQRLCRQGSVPRGASQPFAGCSDPSRRSLPSEPEYTLDAALPCLNSHWFQ